MRHAEGENETTRPKSPIVVCDVHIVHHFTTAVAILYSSKRLWARTTGAAVVATDKQE